MTVEDKADNGPTDVIVDNKRLYDNLQLILDILRYLNRYAERCSPMIGFDQICRHFIEDSEGQLLESVVQLYDNGFLKGAGYVDNGGTISMPGCIYGLSLDGATFVKNSWDNWDKALDMLKLSSMDINLGNMNQMLTFLSK